MNKVGDSRPARLSALREARPRGFVGSASFAGPAAGLLRFSGLSCLHGFGTPGDANLRVVVDHGAVLSNDRGRDHQRLRCRDGLLDILGDMPDVSMTAHGD